MNVHQMGAAPFATARDYLNAGYQIVEGFKIDILHSIETIKEIVQTENKGFKNQIIFLEHDYEPHAYFCGFGTGEYPILDTPTYIKFNYHEELFNGVGKISYEIFWKKRIEFDEQIEALNLSDLLWDSKIYQGLTNAYKFKTYLLLYEAFEQIPIESFSGIPIILPLFIFANDHDCEAMNVFVYD